MAFDLIPHEMRKFKSWVLWRYEMNAAGKWTKVPYNPTTGHPASPTDPNHWVSYDHAFNAGASRPDWYSGIGFVLSDADPYTFIDLDAPKNPDGSDLPPEEKEVRLKNQKRIYEQFSSYTEISPSGNGLHIIVRGEVPAGRKRDSVEIYSSQRFMTMTGNVKRFEPIKYFNGELHELWEEMGKGRVNSDTFYAGLDKETATDEEVIAFAETAGNGELFKDLFYDGNWQKWNYPSNNDNTASSEADFALVDIIGFYSKNRAQTARIFMRSKLGQRQKYKDHGKLLGYMLDRCFDNMAPPLDIQGIANNILMSQMAKERPSSANMPTESKAVVINAEKEYLNLEAPAILDESRDSVFNPPPGLLGDIARFIYSQSFMPIPEISLCGAIGLMCAICGRAYNTPTGTGLNMYTLVLAPTGCHAAGTGILMFDGTVKRVEDVIVGDQLMGPDSKPRNVLALARGRERMVQINPVKGESFVVNEGHILSLKHTTNKTRTNITVRDYIWTNKNFKHLHKLERVGVEFEKENWLPIDPWFLGAWIGDGHCSPSPTITSMDEAIHARASKAAERHDCVSKRYQVPGNQAWQIRYVRRASSGPNKLTNELINLNLYGKTAGDKFIPQIYKTGSRKTRLSILAGIIDTDGYYGLNCYEITSKSERLAKDIQFVARSLGFAAYVKETEKYAQNGTGGIYYRVNISGEGLEEIPVTLEYKKASPRLQKKSALVTGFSMQGLPEDNFYGFALDSDHLYLTEDFTIHHNTGKEEAAKGIWKLMNLASKQCPTAKDFMGPSEIASAPALIKHLTNKSASVLSIIGEFGMYFKAMAGPTAPAHLQTLQRTLLKLYNESGANRTVAGMVYSDSDKNTRELDSPAFSIFAESVPEGFYQSLNESMIESGLLPRFNIIEYKGERVRPNEGGAAALPSDDMMNRFCALIANASMLNNSKMVNVVEQDEEGKKVLWDFYDYADLKIRGQREIFRQLWSRAHMKAMRMASLVAVGINPFNPIITKEAAEWAVRLVKYDTENISKRFESGDVGENSHEIAQIKIVRRLIAKYITDPWEKVARTVGDKGNDKLKPLHDNKLTPYRFLQTSTASYKVFKDDRQGATGALKRALKTLQDCGDIQVVPRSEMVKFGSSTDAYAVVNIAAFSNLDKV